MKPKSIIVILSLVSFVFAANLAHAGTVRGVLTKTTTNGNKKHPARDIPVMLCNCEGENCSSPFYTDGEGKYYFYNVPAGRYVLKIWVRGYKVGKPKTTPPITVLNQPYTDVNEITISPP
jgi:hypothetical protein